MTSSVVNCHRFGARQLSRKTRKKLRSRAQPTAAAVTSGRIGFTWGRNPGRLRNQAVDEHYSRHLVDVKSLIPQIVILPPGGRTRLVTPTRLLPPNSALESVHARAHLWKLSFPTALRRPSSDSRPATPRIQRLFTVQVCGFLWIVRKTRPRSQASPATVRISTRYERAFPS